MAAARLAGTPTETISIAVGSARAMFHVVVVLLKLAQPPCQLPFRSFERFKPPESCMVRSHGELSAIQVRMELTEALHDGEKLFSGDAVIFLGLAELVAVIGHHMFTVILHLRKYCPNPFSTSITVNYVGAAGVRIGQYRGIDKRRLQVIKGALALCVPVEPCSLSGQVVER